MKKDFLPLLAGAAIAVATLAVPTVAFGADPIKIGVIAEAQAVAGSSIGPAAQLAAEDQRQGRRQRPQDRDRGV